MAKRNQKPSDNDTGKVTLSPEEFVKLWQTSQTVLEVAQAMNTSRQVAASRAYHYRQKGVNLKRTPGGRVPLNVDALNAVIAELDAKE